MPSAAVAGHYEIFNPLQNKTVKTLDFFKDTQIAVKMSDGKHLRPIDTHRMGFGNAARFFIFQKQINRATIENFGRYEKYTTLAVEML